MSVNSRRIALPVLLPALVAGLTLTACASTSGTSSGGKAEQAEAASSASSSAAASALPVVENAKNLNVKPTIKPGTPPPPTTLKTQDLVVGTGAAAVASNTVSVRYVGANFADGKEFDSSWANQGTQPAEFALSQVIPGFAQGIVGMKVGGRREIVVPPELGYGASGQPPAIGANETLVFVVDLVKLS